MDINKTTVPVTVVSATPPPPQPDGRAAADAVATVSNPYPNVPVPLPASTLQSGLVSQSALTNRETATKPDLFGVSPAERLLKPYGIIMLPEKRDAPTPEVPPKT